MTFDLDTVVSGIMTKGRADAANWVTSYTLHYSADETVYYPIQQAGADVVSLVLSYKNRNERIQLT